MSRHLIVYTLIVIAAVLAARQNTIMVMQSEQSHSVEQVPDFVQRQVDCLTKNMYFEARGESAAGALAVGHVTLNRAKYKEFGKNDVCKVIAQKSNGVCQFSWWCTPTQKIVDRKRFAELKALAFNLVAFPRKDFTKNALFFHTTSAGLDWTSPSMKKTVIIDNHIFYTKKMQNA